MPLRHRGNLRKRWRYVGVYGPGVMLCAARVEVGPMGHCFWAVWDREAERRYGHTRFRPGGSEVVIDGSIVRVAAGDVKADLRLGTSTPVECVCASGRRGYAWTRKRAGVPVRGTIEAGGRHHQVDALAVDDTSAGYHDRHTSWHWSAGVGTAADGRALAWNLVAGINDPRSGSERAIWIDGEPAEPDPVAFEGLDSVGFADGSRLSFASESERARNDNLILVRSRYRHRFGTFAGSLDGVEVGEAYGVMEEHEAVW
jgi:hypothetical protein